jgi:hypothetical protein
MVMGDPIQIVKSQTAVLRFIEFNPTDLRLVY